MWHELWLLHRDAGTTFRFKLREKSKIRICAVWCCPPSPVGDLGLYFGLGTGLNENTAWDSSKSSHLEYDPLSSSTFHFLLLIIIFFILQGGNLISEYLVRRCVLHKSCSVRRNRTFTWWFYHGLRRGLRGPRGMKHRQDSYTFNIFTSTNLLRNSAPTFMIPGGWILMDLAIS